MVCVKVAVTVIIATLTGVSSVFGNLLLILACLNKVSGKVNVFLINLCVTDILLTAYTPVLGYSMIHGGESLHLFNKSPLCFLSNNHIVIASTANCATILLIAFERYIAIQLPLKYHKIMAKNRMIQLVTICWVCIVGATVLKDVIIWKFDGGPKYKGMKGFCVDEEYNTVIVKILVETIMSGLLLLIPLMVTTVLYCIILLNIYRNGQRFLSLRHKKPTKKTPSPDQPKGHGAFSELLQKKSTDSSENIDKTSDMDTDQVIAELRDLTKNVDVKTIKQSIRRCHGHTSQQNNDNSENTYRNKRVLKKQGTVVDFNNILSEEEFQDIIDNLRKFKNFCDEPNKLSAPSNEHLSSKRKSELSGSSLISRLADGKRECNLRRFHSFESLNELTGKSKKCSPRNIASANSSMRPANRTKRASCTTMKRGTEETCVSSSFMVSEDQDSGDMVWRRRDGLNSKKKHPNGGNQKVLKRQFGRQSSSETLLDMPGTPSIRIKPPGSVKVLKKLTSSQETLPRIQCESVESISPPTGQTITLVTGASRWKHAAVTAATTPDVTNVIEVKSNNSRTAKRELPIPGAATCKWRSAAMTLTTLEQTSSQPKSPLQSSREVPGGSESSSDNWRMLILMMRLAKLAKQPSTLLQEKLGTTRYQIQLVKVALMSCVAFYIFTLPFVIITALPSHHEEDERPAFPILILPLVNCLADFLVYGFMHPTIRHQVQDLLLRPRTLVHCCSNTSPC